MRKGFITALLLIVVSTAFAKKVKFAVDMTGISINATGMHIAGDFQSVIGVPAGDWSSDGTPLIQDVSNPDIYSIVVDLPAFRKYEYKFLNGDQFYDAEFVPVESRVGYDFNDNRWIYVDSLANDTTFAGAILFAGNAPAGMSLVRFMVDMQNESSVSAAGVHIAGDYQGMDPATNRLYTFGSNIYEIINYVTPGLHGFNYINGNTVGEVEVVSGSCAMSGVRVLNVPYDTVLSTVCYSSCSSCVASGIAENDLAANINMYPNPAHEYTVVKFSDNSSVHTVYVRDLTGRIIRTYANYSASELRIEKENMTAGVYFVSVENADKASTSMKLVVQ